MLKFQKEYKKNSNESGRTMMELLTILPIIGILSLVILIGFRQAMHQVAITEITDSLSKSASSIITSNYLNSFTFNPDEPEYILSDTIPLNIYISEVTPTPQNLINAYENDKNFVLDEESFVVSAQTILSAHAFENGKGVFIILRQIPTTMCREVLFSDLKYDYVTILSDKTFDPNNRWYAQKDVVKQNNVIKDICQAVDADNANGLENVLHLGFVFETEGCLLGGKQCGQKTPCSNNQGQSDCSTNISGWCASVTPSQNRSPCIGFECEKRQYWNNMECSYKCYDGDLLDCLCEGEDKDTQTSTLKVFLADTKQCGTCPIDKPIYDWPTKTCQACPNGQVWSSDTPVPSYHPNFDPNNSIQGCVECNDIMDCNNPNKPICNTNTHSCY